LFIAYSGGLRYMISTVSAQLGVTDMIAAAQPSPLASPLASPLLWTSFLTAALVIVAAVATPLMAAASHIVA
jgi:hypothetical protein